MVRFAVRVTLPAACSESCNSRADGPHQL